MRTGGHSLSGSIDMREGSGGPYLVVSIQVGAHVTANVSVSVDNVITPSSDGAIDSAIDLVCTALAVDLKRAVRGKL